MILGRSSREVPNLTGARKVGGWLDGETLGNRVSQWFSV